MSLKPLGQRTETAQQIIDRLRPKLAQGSGRDAVSDRGAGRARGRTAGQRGLPVHHDQRQRPGSDHLGSQDAGRAEEHQDHRRREHGPAEPRAWRRMSTTTAARRRGWGSLSQLIDNTLYDAFGQAPVSTMFTSLNQYFVVMEAAPKYWQNPDMLRRIFVTSPPGEHVPLGAFAHFDTGSDRAGGVAPGLVPGGDHFLQPAERRRAGRRGEGHQRQGARGGLPSNIQTGLRGNGGGISGFAQHLSRCWWRRR